MAYNNLPNKATKGNQTQFFTPSLPNQNQPNSALSPKPGFYDPPGNQPPPVLGAAEGIQSGPFGQTPPQPNTNPALERSSTPPQPGAPPMSSSGTAAPSWFAPGPLPQGAITEPGEGPQGKTGSGKNVIEGGLRASPDGTPFVAAGSGTGGFGGFTSQMAGQKADEFLAGPEGKKAGAAEVAEYMRQGLNEAQAVEKASNDRGQKMFQSMQVGSYAPKPGENFAQTAARNEAERVAKEAEPKEPLYDFGNLQKQADAAGGDGKSLADRVASGEGFNPGSLGLGGPNGPQLTVKNPDGTKGSPPLGEKPWSPLGRSEGFNGQTAFNPDGSLKPEYTGTTGTPGTAMPPQSGVSISPGGDVPAGSQPPTGSKPGLQRLFDFLKGDLTRERDKAKSESKVSAASRGVFYGTPGVDEERNIDEQFGRGLGQLEADILQREQGNELQRLQLATGLIPNDMDASSDTVDPSVFETLGGLFGNRPTGGNPANPQIGPKPPANVPLVSTPGGVKPPASQLKFTIPKSQAK